MVNEGSTVRQVDSVTGGETEDAVPPEVTIVVPAYRGRATILSCLGSIQKAAVGWRCEVIVVESSGDGAAELVRGHFPGVTVIASPIRLSAGKARNEGLARARARWVLCVDQDCLVPEDWIGRLVGLLQQPGPGAAGGSIAVANPSNLSGWCVYFVEFLGHFPSRAAVRDDNFLIGANSAWHSEVVSKVRFPDQTLGEDLLLSEEVRRMGLAVRYDPQITVRHHNREGWGEFVRYCRAMGMAAAVDQGQMGAKSITVLRRMPSLSFAIPLVRLPRIAVRLWGGRPAI